tara:strand:+ start:106 stop:480 length:375 start_codon:yes stop_codon:yes gene_type:complete
LKKKRTQLCNSKQLKTTQNKSRSQEVKKSRSQEVKKSTGVQKEKKRTQCATQQLNNFMSKAKSGPAFPDWFGRVRKKNVGEKKQKHSPRQLTDGTGSVLCFLAFLTHTIARSVLRDHLLWRWNA